MAPCGSKHNALIGERHACPKGYNRTNIWSMDSFTSRQFTKNKNLVVMSLYMRKRKISSEYLSSRWTIEKLWLPTQRTSKNIQSHSREKRFGRQENKNLYDVDAHEVTMLQSPPQELRGLRRQGNKDLRTLVAKLRELPFGHGRKSSRNDH